MPPETPREQLMKTMGTRHGTGTLHGALAGRRIALALLDVADAIREHAAATQARPTVVTVHQSRAGRRH